MSGEAKDLGARKRLEELRAQYDSLHDIATSTTEEEIKNSWETAFTNPRKHNHRRFCYLVHGLAGGHARAIMTVETLEYHIEQGTTPPPIIDLSKEPLRIAEKKIISASVIDQNHRRTFADAGLIIRAPFENLLRMAKTDLGTDFMEDPEKILAELKAKRRLATVEELLQQSITHNEVVLTGTTGAGKVEVVGFWNKTDKQGYPLDASTMYQLVDLSLRYGMPRVSVIDK